MGAAIKGQKSGGCLLAAPDPAGDGRVRRWRLPGWGQVVRGTAVSLTIFALILFWRPIWEMLRIVSDRQLVIAYPDQFPVATQDVAQDCGDFGRGVFALALGRRPRQTVKGIPKNASYIYENR